MFPSRGRLHSLNPLNHMRQEEGKWFKKHLRLHHGHMGFWRVWQLYHRHSLIATPAQFLSQLQSTVDVLSRKSAASACWGRLCSKASVAHAVPRWASWPRPPAPSSWHWLSPAGTERGLGPPPPGRSASGFSAVTDRPAAFALSFPRPHPERKPRDALMQNAFDKIEEIKPQNNRLQYSTVLPNKIRLSILIKYY